MCKVASFKNFENSLTTVKVMTKTKVAPFYLGHGVVYYADHVKCFMNYSVLLYCLFLCDLSSVVSSLHCVPYAVPL